MTHEICLACGENNDRPDEEICTDCMYECIADEGYLAYVENDYYPCDMAEPDWNL